MNKKTTPSWYITPFDISSKAETKNYRFENNRELQLSFFMQKFLKISIPIFLRVQEG